MTRLSPREREIVELIGGDGAQYKTVAAKLEISVHTVREYVRRIRQRSGIERDPREALTILYERQVVAAVSDAASDSTVEGD